MADAFAEPHHRSGGRRPWRRSPRGRMRRAFLLADVAAAAVLLLVTMLLISLAGWHLYTAQQYAAAQRALRLAAEGELARWRAGLQPAPSSAPGLRAVGADQAGDPITLRTTSLPGTGPWQGFTHVRVVAQRLARDHVWQFEFCGYVLSPVSSEGDP